MDGAPNFRQVPGLPVYGVAIPTMAGIRNVLSLIDAKSRVILWHNMREEPVLYINGHPYVLREMEQPFSNLEYPGITRARVEAMELRLKHDVLKEAAQYEGAVMVSYELPDGRVVDKWETVKDASAVWTPAEVYRQLAQEGFLVRGGGWGGLPVPRVSHPRRMSLSVARNPSAVPPLPPSPPLPLGAILPRPRHRREGAQGAGL